MAIREALYDIEGLIAHCHQQIQSLVGSVGSAGDSAFRQMAHILEQKQKHDRFETVSVDTTESA